MVKCSPGEALMRVLVGGVADSLARKIAERLRDDSRGDPGGRVVESVTGLDARALTAPLDGITFVRARIAQVEWQPVLDRIDVAVWVVGDVQPARYAARERDQAGALGELRAFLRAVEAHGTGSRLRKLVVINDAALYGRQAAGPVVENAPVRGYESGMFERMQARAADMIAVWAQTWPGTVTQLRPARVCGANYRWLADWLVLARPMVCGSAERVIQVVDEEDVVSAAVLALHNDLPGVYHVAADAGIPLGALLAQRGLERDCAPLAWQMIRAWWLWRWCGGRMPPGLVRDLAQGAWLEASRWRAASGWTATRDSYETVSASLDA